MKTLPLVLAGLAVASAGCLSLKPVGPMASMMTDELPAKPAPGVTVTPPRDTAGPVVQAAPAPPPPALRVTPGEVTPATAQQAVRQLIEEMEADRKAMEAMPRPAEISVVK